MEETKTLKVNLNPKALDAAVSAMHAHHVSIARQAIDRTEFDASAMIEIFRRLHHDSETSQVLVVASYLEDRITTLLQYQLIHIDSLSAKEQLFGSNGPLGSFGSRITMAYHLGWLSKQSVDKLNNFRKIRNIFAHNAFRVSYADRNIRDLFAPLIEGLKAFSSILESQSVAEAIKEALESDKTVTLKRVADAAEEESNLCALALLTGDVFRDLLVLPAATRNQVDPSDIMSSFDAQPKVISDLMRTVVRCALEIFASADSLRASTPS